MDIIFEYFKKPFVRRIFVLACIGLILFGLRSQMTLLLLTFIFVYIFNSAQKFIYRLLSPFIKMERKVIIISLYLLIVGFLFLIIYIYVPQIIQQVTNIIKSISSVLENKEAFPKPANDILGLIFENSEKVDIQGYIKSSSTMLINFISGVGSVSLNLLLALILSLFFLLEKERIKNFARAFEHSKINWFYEELVYFSVKFTNSFGKVIQAQILIALINATLSTIFLSILGFPNIIGLFMLIFIFGLIPVAGVIISLFPLIIISFSIGGFRYVLYVIFMIIVLHSLEAYFLNPKLMSRNTKLPIFITFLVLCVSEHFFGIWGLIVGIPIAVFVLDVLEVKFDLTKN